MNPSRLLSDAAYLMAVHPMLQRLIAASLELAALSLAILLLVRVLRSRAPRLVQMLWLVVLTKPLVSLCTGSILPVIQLDPLAPVAQSAGSESGLDHASLPPQPRWANVPVAMAGSGDAREAFVVPSFRNLDPPPPPPAPVLTSDGVARGIIWIWGAGAMLAATAHLRARWRL